MLLRFVLLAGFALLTPALRAQVVFQRQITADGSDFSRHAPLLGASNAPFDLSDPLYNSSTTDWPWVVSSQVYYRINPTDAAVSPPASLPLSVRLTTDTFVSFAGRNTSNPILFVLGYRKTLWIVSLAGTLPTVPGPDGGVPVPVGTVGSMAAADRTHLTMIADGWFYTVNITTGGVTPIFSLDGGTGPGQFSNDESAGADRGTHFHAYGPNGLLYVLDYGNDRMQILDPGNAFAYVSEFSLESSVTTVNVGFAIGVNGNIYLADGQGGGSTYSADGDFLGAFTSSITPTPTSQSAGRAYIETDSAGNVYVFEGYSQFQYLDLSVVPEPSTSALAGLAALTLAAWRRRHKREGKAQL